MPEHQNIEYKQAWHDDYLKWICGFANARGGSLFPGMDEFKGGYIDGWGRGTIKIIEACQKAGLAEPEMTEAEGGFWVTLRIEQASATHQVSPKPTHQVNILKNKGLNKKTGVTKNRATHQVTHQVISLLLALHSSTKSRDDLMRELAMRDVVNFRRNFVNPALTAGFIERTQPDKPRSPTQKYRLTARGLAVLKGE
ncbi:putative HTH transcriptional regulator [Ereboglobus sp. PH5-10]|uniref:AlbA family DNA-binding domain-containing protein n=1 Tax=Ereboglobus sp. PH5-10 TaxID=2940629 RepID=UPI00240639EB|nr:RNA-binding domain-containing protein [Ereboglobus sp. PH5-10]MDF9827935.1 putative HTH transcriptional regulator [Ereboglobus sp. PH5-10]